MATTHLIAARCTSETKQRFRALAAHQSLTESALLKRMITLALYSLPSTEFIPQRAASVSRKARVSVRLRLDDQRLLKERASARQLTAATYVALLIRTHLHGVAPIPQDELTALKRASAELAAIGRNVNQLVRVAQRSGQVEVPQRAEVMALIQVCTVLHDKFKAVLKVNLDAWDSGEGRDVQPR